MDNMVKRIICILVGLIVMFNLSACFVNEHIDKNEIREIGEHFNEMFVQKNVDELYNCFCSDIQENRKEETIEEIQKAFDFIDGNITEYKFSMIGFEEEHKREGIIQYYSIDPICRNVKTDKGNQYTIYYSYCHIYKSQPNYEGIWKITVVDNDDNEISIGQFYPAE